MILSSAHPPDLARLREFLDRAFDGDFSNDDWEHTLGGIHVWIEEGGVLVSHAAIVERRLVCVGQPLVAAYVEAVATAAPDRRQGHGSRVMREVNRIIDERFAAGALSTGEPRFYARLGWELWLGPTWAAGPDGHPRRTPDDDGGIMFLRTPRTPPLDPRGAILAGWRTGDAW